MLGKSFCVFIVLCGYVNRAACNRDIFIKHPSTDVQVRHYKFAKTKFNKILPTTYNGGTRNKKISRRGIVMVDSDFDVPSEIFTYENENDLDTGDVFGKTEGSGTDEHSEEPFKTTEETNKSTSELQKVTNISTVLTESSSKATKSTTEKIDIVTSINTEGSGDDGPLITEEYFTYGTSTKNYITPNYDILEKVPHICMNSTCGTNDLFILTSEERINIPEGINFTLTCISNNHSHHNMLYWYKSNNSEYFLQTLGNNAQLNFNVPDTKPIHCGTYMCVKWVDKETCCNIKWELTVYEVPLYQYHLIIIGLITLVGVALCIFLSVRQSIVLKKYTKTFAEKHGNLKNLL